MVAVSSVCLDEQLILLLLTETIIQRKLFELSVTTPNNVVLLEP